MKRAKLQQIVLYEGRIMQVYALGDGMTVSMREVGVGPCPTCEQMPDVHLLEHSPLFQREVSPVPTISENPVTVKVAWHENAINAAVKRLIGFRDRLPGPSLLHDEQAVMVAIDALRAIQQANDSAG